LLDLLKPVRERLDQRLLTPLEALQVHLFLEMLVLLLVHLNFIAMEVFLVIHRYFKNGLNPFVNLFIFLHHDHLLKFSIFLEGIKVEVFVEAIVEVFLQVVIV
jgi:hypothetical protein